MELVMKTEEDEAFDELSRKQGDWGGGFPAKRKAAADKLQDGKCKYCVDGCAACDARAQPAQPLQPTEKHVTSTLPPFPEPEVHDADGWTITYYSASQMTAYALEAAKYALAAQPVQPAQEPDMLTIAYQSGYHDGKKAALAGREWNFCERCGKRTKDMTTIHTCTPPQD
jgi:hypothetical protein